jgi:hypothetical protein
MNKVEKVEKASKLFQLGVFCKSFLPKVANNFSIVLQLHFP